MTPSQHSPVGAARALELWGTCALLNGRLRDRSSQRELNAFLQLAERALVHPQDSLRCQAVDGWRRLVCNLAHIRKPRLVAFLTGPVGAAQIGGARSPATRCAMAACWCELANVAAERDDAFATQALADFCAVAAAVRGPALQGQLLTFLGALLEPLPPAAPVSGWSAPPARPGPARAGPPERGRRCGTAGGQG